MHAATDIFPRALICELWHLNTIIRKATWNIDNFVVFSVVLKLTQVVCACFCFCFWFSPFTTMTRCGVSHRGRWRRLSTPNLISLLSDFYDEHLIFSENMTCLMMNNQKPTLQGARWGPRGQNMTVLFGGTPDHGGSGYSFGPVNIASHYFFFFVSAKGNHSRPNRSITIFTAVQRRVCVCVCKFSVCDSCSFRTILFDIILV